jgi:hypothetical protein
MMYVIDRIDGQTALLEDIKTQKILQIPVQHLPTGAKEGDALQSQDGQWTLNREETARRHARISQKMERLKSRGKRS